MQTLRDAHCESLPHWLTQRLPLQPRNGAQLRAAGHLAAAAPADRRRAVSVLAAVSQRPDRQVVPSR